MILLLIKESVSLSYYAIFLAFPFPTQTGEEDKAKYALDNHVDCVSASRTSSSESAAPSEKMTKTGVQETITIVPADKEDEDMNQLAHPSLNIV
jgi:hypothetical protein